MHVTHQEEVELLPVEKQRALPEDHPQITRVGHWLRRLSLDELPQLINVLRGEMSLIGPRPGLLWQVALHTPEQRRRLDVKPGITGWSQVNGRNSPPWEEKIALDLWYVDHRSFWLDLRILLKTPKAALSQSEIYFNGQGDGWYASSMAQQGESSGSIATTGATSSQT
jgi:sugar transferase EpsL